MERIDGWEMRLDDFIKSRQFSKFEWGVHDCALFSCDAIREMTSVDVAEYFRDSYTTKDEAYSLLLAFSGGGLEETVEILSEEFSMEEIERNYAGRGDWVLCNVPTVINEELPTLGIVGLSEMIYITGTRQLQIFDKSCGVRFWRV